MTYTNQSAAETQLGQQSGGNATANMTQSPSAGFIAGGVGGAQATQLSDYKIIRRNGSVVAFEPSKIAIAVTKAFLAVNGGQGAASARVREQVEQLTHAVVRALLRSRPNGGTFHIEDIQDQVELALDYWTDLALLQYSQFLHNRSDYCRERDYATLDTV
jgi:ribonucleoside-diphosphate reductase alpha chain